MISFYTLQMLLKKYYINHLYFFLLIVTFFVLQSCNTTSKVQAISVEIPRDNKPVEKLSVKTASISETQKEEVKLSVNNNENVFASALFTQYANILGVQPSELSNQKLYSLIDEWWNVPYKYAGNSKKGIDCSGFSCMVLKSVYNTEIIRGSSEMYRITDRVKKEELKEGDLVFFRIRHGHISHVGVYLKNNMFVHASVKYGVTISSLDDPYYKKVFASGGRLTNDDRTIH